MSFRTKLFLLFLVTVLACVSAVTYSVAHYTRAAYEEADTQRTQALVEQFQKEFAQQRELVARARLSRSPSASATQLAVALESQGADGIVSVQGEIAQAGRDFRQPASVGDDVIEKLAAVVVVHVGGVDIVTQ